MSFNKLSVWDYVVFGLMLLISSFIGLYHGYKSSKNKTASNKDYLLAGQSIGWFPLFVSLVASYLSAIALLGIPSEIYTYGAMYVVVMLSYPLFILQCVFIYAPIFRKNKITSANEYLEMRFSKPVRIVGCIMFIIEYVLYLSVVLFAPSLALQAVAGVPMEISLVTTGIVCNIYTTIGGMKGVIWTDVFQTAIMIIGLIVVISIGSNEVGGISEVFKIAKDGGRLDIFNFNPDPRIRNTFWSLVIGGTFSAMPVYCIGQMMVQRFLAGKSLKTVKIALLMNIPGLILIIGLCSLAGLVMYAVYEKCDLRKNGQIQSNDQILAYFLVNKLSHLKGVPGIFMASLFSGALSTASSGLNSLAAVTYEDLVQPFQKNASPQKAAKISKIIAFLYGFVILGCAFVVSYVGTMVLQIAYAIHGVVGAPLMGMFCLGMLFPWANSIGALLGCFFGFSVTCWLAAGAILFPPNRNVLPVSIEQCPTFNSTITNTTGIIEFPFTPHSDPLASFYSLSYMWYAAVGLIVSFVTGCLFSLAANLGRREDVNPDLLFNYTEFWRSITCRGESWKKKEEYELTLHAYKTTEY